VLAAAAYIRRSSPSHPAAQPRFSSVLPPRGTTTPTCSILVETKHRDGAAPRVARRGPRAGGGERPSAPVERGAVQPAARPAAGHNGVAALRRDHRVPQAGAELHEGKAPQVGLANPRDMSPLLCFLFSSEKQRSPCFACSAFFSCLLETASIIEKERKLSFLDPLLGEKKAILRSIPQKLIPCTVPALAKKQTICAMPTPWMLLLHASPSTD
jgi:hypothetical protein